MSSGGDREKRRFFRLRYPTTDRPKLNADGSVFQVTEVSEGGVVFSCAEAVAFHLGQPVSAAVQFADGHVMRVTGTVLRMSLKEVVVQLTYGIPSNRIFQEQLYLKKHHTDVRSFSNA